MDWRSVMMAWTVFWPHTTPGVLSVSSRHLLSVVLVCHDTLSVCLYKPNPNPDPATHITLTPPHTYRPGRVLSEEGVHVVCQGVNNVRDTPEKIHNGEVKLRTTWG